MGDYPKMEFETKTILNRLRFVRRSNKCLKYFAPNYSQNTTTKYFDVAGQTTQERFIFKIIKFSRHYKKLIEF